MKSEIYLDNLATTPLDPKVLETMIPWFSVDYGNPNSQSHSFGQRAHRAIEKARSEVAEAVNADALSIIFTSGATEANNIAILGVTAAAKCSKRKILVPLIEHKSVLETAKSLRKKNYLVKLLKVRKNGLVNINDLKNNIDRDTLLVSVMAVNNETGVIQPIEEISKICAVHGSVFHVDCAQGLGKIPVDVSKINADLMSFSAHKIYGPKGIGALYIRRKPRVQINQINFGGTQEKGLRPGTLPVPLCVGFGHACKISNNQFAKEHKMITNLASQLYNGIKYSYPKAKLNGHLEHKVAGTLNIMFPGLIADEMIRAFDGLAISTGSACMSSTNEPSHVLKAMGLSNNQAGSSIRFSVGRFNTVKDIEKAICIIKSGLKCSIKE